MSTPQSRIAKREAIVAGTDRMGRAERWLETEKGQAFLMGALVVVGLVGSMIH